jgi:phosphopantetheinyl transferase (holo-ACP synthase)
MTPPGMAAAAVQSMLAAGRQQPVFYASLAPNTEASRHLLVSALWEHVLALKHPAWDHYQALGKGSSLQVVSGPLGRPDLQVGGKRGPAISFSAGAGAVWAALSGDDSDIGIDVAEAAEFAGDYPVHRVFHPEELQHAVKLTGGDRAMACALLWSVKEAAVKALGCAFHRVDPLQVRVLPPVGETPGSDGGHDFPVVLSTKAQSLLPPSAECSLSVHARPLSQLWLSIAHLNRRPESHA